VCKWKSGNPNADLLPRFDIGLPEIVMISPDRVATLFRSIGRDQLSREPFPYLCIENFLDEDLFRALAAGAPSLERVASDQAYPDDFKIYWRSPQVLDDPALSPACRQIFQAFMSREVLQSLIDLFEPEINLYHPKLDVAELRNGEVGYRRGGGSSDIMTDAQYIIYLPVHERPRAERGPHLKGSKKLFKGFVSLRDDDDHSDGGDTRIYRVRSSYAPPVGARSQIDESHLDVARVIPRRKNTLVLVFNTQWSVTDLSPRGLSRHASKYFNFVTELSASLFEIPDKQPKQGSSLIRKALTQLRARFGG
jgi:hypothetical protein